jgi:hypothetical protein
MMALLGYIFAAFSFIFTGFSGILALTPVAAPAL